METSKDFFRLRTICTLYFNTLLHNFPLSFRLLEQNLMTYARQMFFLMLLYDTELTVSNKAEIFLEIYGNTQLCLKSYEVRKTNNFQ